VTWVDAGETILWKREASDDSVTIRGGASRRRITFDSSGFSAGYNVTLKVCDQRGREHARSVLVSNTGRARIRNGASACP